MNTHVNAIRFELLSQNQLTQLYAIETSAHSHPMSLNTLSSCFGALYFNIAIMQDGAILGFALVHQVIDEASLIDICISPSAQKKGFGKKLMMRVIEEAKDRQASKIQLEVRASNKNAQRLYEHCGFVTIARRKNYYPCQNDREDAMMMTLALN